MNHEEPSDYHNISRDQNDATLRPPMSFGDEDLMSDSASSSARLGTASDVKDSQSRTLQYLVGLSQGNLSGRSHQLTVSSSCRNADPPPSLISSRASTTMRYYGSNCALRLV